jgi:hypothetical protein
LKYPSFCSTPDFFVIGNDISSIGRRNTDIFSTTRKSKMKFQTVLAIACFALSSGASASCNDLNAANYINVKTLMQNAKTSAMAAHNAAVPSATSTIATTGYDPMIASYDTFLGYAMNTGGEYMGSYAMATYGPGLDNWLSSLRYWTTMNVLYNRASFNRPAAFAAANAALADMEALVAAVKDMESKARACVLSAP